VNGFGTESRNLNDIGHSPQPTERRITLAILQLMFQIKSCYKVIYSPVSRWSLKTKMRINSGNGWILEVLAAS